MDLCQACVIRSLGFGLGSNPEFATSIRLDVIDENYLGMCIPILAFDSIPSLQHRICHAYVVVSNVERFVPIA